MLSIAKPSTLAVITQIWNILQNGSPSVWKDTDGNMHGGPEKMGDVLIAKMDPHETVPTRKELVYAVLNTIKIFAHDTVKDNTHLQKNPIQREFVPSAQKLYRVSV